MSRLPTKFSKRSHLLLFRSEVSCLNQNNKMVLCKLLFWQLSGCWQAHPACDIQADIHSTANIKWRSFHRFRKRFRITSFSFIPLQSVFTIDMWFLLEVKWVWFGLVISPYVNYHCICNTNPIFQIELISTKLLWYLCPWDFFTTFLNLEFLSIADIYLAPG